jgi:hypothetical protein
MTFVPSPHLLSSLVHNLRNPPRTFQKQGTQQGIFVRSQNTVPPLSFSQQFNSTQPKRNKTQNPPTHPSLTSPRYRNVLYPIPSQPGLRITRRRHALALTARSPSRIHAWPCQTKRLLVSRLGRDELRARHRHELFDEGIFLLSCRDSGL